MTCDYLNRNVYRQKRSLSHRSKRCNTVNDKTNCKKMVEEPSACRDWVEARKLKAKNSASKVNTWSPRGQGYEVQGHGLVRRTQGLEMGNFVKYLRGETFDESFIFSCLQINFLKFHKQCCAVFYQPVINNWIFVFFDETFNETFKNDAWNISNISWNLWNFQKWKFHGPSLTGPRMHLFI